MSAVDLEPEVRARNDHNLQFSTLKRCSKCYCMIDNHCNLYTNTVNAKASMNLRYFVKLSMSPFARFLA